MLAINGSELFHSFSCAVMGLKIFKRAKSFEQGTVCRYGMKLIFSYFLIMGLNFIRVYEGAQEHAQEV